MKNILIMTLFFVSFSSFSQSEIPNMSLKNIKGKNIKLSTYSNSDKIVIISFWSTWCASCIKELEAIKEHYGKWQKDLNVELIAVSIDDARTKNYVTPMVNSKKWEYTILLDENHEFKRRMNVVDIPYTVVYYKNKRVLTHTSYTPGYEKTLYEKLKELRSSEDE